MKTLTIAVPSYSRPSDIKYLLETIVDLEEYPNEVLIVDDCSPDFDQIEANVLPIFEILRQRSVVCRLEKNESNLGYDRNLRKLLKLANSDLVMFIGNDDAVDPHCVRETLKFYRDHNVLASSRSFHRFYQSISSPYGRSWFFKGDRIINRYDSTPNVFYRLCAYFGGLVFDRRWAISKETDIFDGTLYYQLYLTGCAYYEGGVGYIDYPIVGARIGGVPLFGNNSLESSVHTPGNYSTTARAHMWQSIRYVADYLSSKYDSTVSHYIDYELKTRMSFHLFEMFAAAPRRDLFNMVSELRKLKLYWHPVPVFLTLLVAILGRRSVYIFHLIRKVYQK